MAFQLDIQTPTEPVFEGEVESLIAPGTEGYLGVLAHHAPLITGLVPGHLEATLADGSKRTFFVTGGFLEVSRNHAIVLADALEPAESIDADEAQRVLDKLRQARPAPGDVAQAEQQLARARARLRAARRARGDSF